MSRLNTIVIILLMSYNILYFFSLGTCPYSYEDPNLCIAYFRSMYPVWLGETILSGIFWFFVAILAINGYVSKKWLIVCVVNYFLLFFYQSGTVMRDHGGLNRTVFTMTLTVLFLLYFTGCFFRKLYIISRKLFAAIIFSILFGSWLFYTKNIKHS